MEKDPEKRITVSQVLAHPWVQGDPAKQLNISNGISRKALDSSRLPLNSMGFGRKRMEEIRPKARTKYEDLYRSMSITPYLHQLHYPMQEEHNRVEISEDELDEFENLRKIALVRSNRTGSSSRRKRVRKNSYKLYEKFIRIMGMKMSNGDKN